MDPFGADQGRQLDVELYTAAYRVNGRLRSRFSRVADLVNQQSTTHLSLEGASVQPHGGGAPMSGEPVLVALDEVLVIVAPELDAKVDAAPQPEMEIRKRPVRAQLGVPPLLVEGTLHVPSGSRAVDGLLNASERFVALDDVTVSSAAHPELRRSAVTAAVRRDRAHVVVLADSGAATLDDFIDQGTAEAWLRRGHEGEPTP